MQVAKYWRNNKLRYRLLGMKRQKHPDRVVLRPVEKPVLNREDRLPRERFDSGG